MTNPFRRKKSLPERLLQAAAKAAGVARLALRRSALRSQLGERRHGGRLGRVLRSG
jgi:hypothetical protein